MNEVIDLCSSEEDDSSPSRKSTRCQVDDLGDLNECPPKKAKKAPQNEKTQSDSNVGAQCCLFDGTCILTAGLVPGLQNLSSYTYCFCTQTTLCHIQQKDRWSCGFRNLQMLLTALLPLLPDEHPCWGHIKRNNEEMTSTPSLFKIQGLMEECWKQGFDREGAVHYKRKLKGKKAWIGAVEVSSVLAFLSIDSIVVQFIKCPQSRHLLIAFCVSYFLGVDGESDVEPMVTWLLESAKNGVGTRQIPTVAGRRLPLYLQWKGHSVMVVGIEKGKGSTFHLLLFDPAKSGTKISAATNKSDTTCLRLNTRRLGEKDWQVVVCLPRTLEHRERELMKSCVKSAIAAEEAVQRMIST